MRVLIAEDDPISHHILSLNLRKWGHEVIATQDGLQALQALRQEDAPRLAILDWMMPGRDGLQLCRELRADPNTASIYVILLTALTGKDNVVAGLEAGADDYVTKPFDLHELRVRVQAGVRIVELQASLAHRIRDLEAAIAGRQRVEDELRNLSLTDDLTGLYNHRGFFTLAKHWAKQAVRNLTNSLLIYTDMDGLKEINDTLGHQEGSVALLRIADVLRQSFRESDIIGRLGGDEFAILAAEVPTDDVTAVVKRLHDNLDAENRRSGQPYDLSLSVGWVFIQHDSNQKIEEMIAEADANMYEDKRRKKCLNWSPIAMPPPSSSSEIVAQ